MEHCDALIVGGGPAGSTCARRLSQAGLDVLVLDKSAFPRDKTCAGWITPAVPDLLQIDLDDYARGRVCQPIRGFRVSQIGRREVPIRYGQPVSYGIRRCEFDHYLLQRSGARLRLGEPVRSIKRSNGSWQVNGQIETPLLIGAGGHFCPVARHVGADRGSAERTVVAQEVEFELTAAQAHDCQVQSDAPELHFCDDLRGYGWCFRKGDYLNVGLGREDSARLSEHVLRFVDTLIRAGRIPRDTPRRFRGHAYTLYGHAPRRIVGDRVLLIGDAAGMAYPLSGEGILTAIESGILAAEAVIEANGEYGGDGLERYRERLIARLGPLKARDGWPPFLPVRLTLSLAGWLFTVPWFVRRVVLERWFLHGPAYGPVTTCPFPPLTRTPAHRKR